MTGIPGWGLSDLSGEAGGVKEPCSGREEEKGTRERAKKEKRTRGGKEESRGGGGQCRGDGVCVCMCDFLSTIPLHAALRKGVGGDSGEVFAEH